MRTIRPSAPDRIGAAMLTGALAALLGYALIAGLSVHLPIATPDTPLAIFDVPPPPPPPIVPNPPPAHRPKPQGSAAPPHIVSTPTEIVAPVISLLPPPVITAPLAGTQADVSAGAAPTRGPGTGSGGTGTGLGGGGSGDGPGGGGDGTPPRQIGGWLRKRDYPRHLGPRSSGTVSVLYVVSVSGRVTDCEITHPSGNNRLDDATCDLIIKRYRYEPSRDSTGQPIETMVEQNHSWTIDEQP